MAALRCCVGVCSLANAVHRSQGPLYLSSFLLPPSSFLLPPFSFLLSPSSFLAIVVTGPRAVPGLVLLRSCWRSYPSKLKESMGFSAVGCCSGRNSQPLALHHHLHWRASKCDVALMSCHVMVTVTVTRSQGSCCIMMHAHGSHHGMERLVEAVLVCTPPVLTRA